MAVLHQRKRTHDGFRGWSPRTQAGFRRGRRGIRFTVEPALHRKYSDSDLLFLEMFKSDHYEDVSLAEWMAHTPHLLVNQHLHVGQAILGAISKEKEVITPK